MASGPRRELLGSRLMGVYGVLEREGEVVHLIAKRARRSLRHARGVADRESGFPLNLPIGADMDAHRWRLHDLLPSRVNKSWQFAQTAIKLSRLANPPSFCGSAARAARIAKRCGR